MLAVLEIRLTFALDPMRPRAELVPKLFPLHGRHLVIGRGIHSPNHSVLLFAHAVGIVVRVDINAIDAIGRHVGLHRAGRVSMGFEQGSRSRGVLSRASRGGVVIVRPGKVK